MTTQTWQLSALKYDQRLHYTFPATLVSDDGEVMRFHSAPGANLIHYTRGFQGPQRRCDATFWRERWYNVYANYDEQEVFSHLYCNVAMPPVVDANTLRFVDLDLDVRFYPGGRYEILDEDEFIEHSKQYQYPEWLQARARQALNEVMEAAASKLPPFDMLYRGT